MHPRLVSWLRDNPADPDRPELTLPDVQRLISAIAPGSQTVDLGGTMSLNVLLEPSRLVLRVHQPFVTRSRILAVQELRRSLAQQGLVVPRPVAWRGRTVLRCGGRRWAELEEYLPHERLEPSVDSYNWLFGAMGMLHRALARVYVRVPRPLVATYAPLGSLRRWLAVTEQAVREDPQARQIARLVRRLVGLLGRQWVPAAKLPVQLVHGDVRLSNVCLGPEGQAVYLDFGFAANRPRVHDIAYALAFMVPALNRDRPPEQFDWGLAGELVRIYETAAGSRLAPAERRALSPYAASIPLYAAALSGFAREPAESLRGRLPFLRLSEWLLTHPEIGIEGAP